MLGSAIKLVLQIWALTAVLAWTGLLPRATYQMAKLAYNAQRHMMSHSRMNDVLTTPAHHHPKTRPNRR